MANFVSSSLGNFKNFSYFLKVSIFNFKISFSIQFVRNAGLSKSAAKWELEVKLPKIKELKEQDEKGEIDLRYFVIVRRECNSY